MGGKKRFMTYGRKKSIQSSRAACDEKAICHAVLRSFIGYESLRSQRLKRERETRQHERNASTSVLSTLTLGPDRKSDKEQISFSIDYESRGKYKVKPEQRGICVAQRSGGSLCCAELSQQFTAHSVEDVKLKGCVERPLREQTWRKLHALSEQSLVCVTLSK